MRWVSAGAAMPVQDHVRDPGLRGDFIQTGRDEPGAGERPGGDVEDLLATLRRRRTGPASVPPLRLVGRKAAIYPHSSCFPKMRVPGNLVRAVPAS